MALAPGTTLGPYAVTAKIGEGGMGEVYRARDTKLDRDVALKVLPEAFTQDPDRLARFEREAKVLASLNHPNIAQIHGLEESDGIRALVLELVEGPTLADRIKQGPIPLDEALPIAKQIAEALEAAHEAGVIHRDLKPANIKVRDDGTVKVLDFGLAKAFQPDANDPSLSQSPTISLTAAATQMGMVIGTAAYMAPEQASGKVVDKRADVWAFGVVLYEMLTGRRLFGGEDVSHTLAYVLTKDIDWTSLSNDTPEPLRRLLRRCLERDQRKRLRDIGDARVELEEPLTSPIAERVDTSGLPPRQVWQRPIPLLLASVALLLIGGYAAWTFVGTDAPPFPTRFTLTLPDGVGLPAGSGDMLALSPDGQTIVYRARDAEGFQLFRRPVDQFEATPIPGTENGASPFFSPDGQWIAFSQGGALVKVSLVGGPAQTLTTQTGNIRGAEWGPDDMIVYGLDTGENALMRIPASGGEPTTLFASDDGRRAWYPQVLAGGEAVLFTLAGTVTDPAELHLLLPGTGEHRTLLPGAAKGRVLSTGHLVFVRSGALWAVPFDSSAIDIVGSPAPVLEGVRVESGGAVQYATADDGSLVYIPGRASDATRSLVWVDRRGEEEVVTLPLRGYETLSLSPDGTRVAVVAGASSGNRDIWISELARGTLTRLTTQPGDDTYPLWSADGQRVAFMSREDSGVTIYVQAADGSGTPDRLLTNEMLTALVPYDWSPDGETLFLTAFSPETDRDVGMVSTDGLGTWEPLIQTPAREQSPAISPDGRWLAYASDESGRSEVYVQRFPDFLGRQQVSVESGYRPRWSEDGRELFYLRAPVGPPTAVVRVTVEATNGDPPALNFGPEEVLFDWRYHIQADPMQFYDVSPDGQRFLMITSNETDEAGSGRAEIKVVLNWTEELKARVPVD